jgi:hypothetical protein
MSGNAFKKTKPVNYFLVKPIIDDFIIHLKINQTIKKCINLNFYKLLGSTRKIIKENNRSLLKQIGDIDLLFLINKNEFNINKIIQLIQLNLEKQNLNSKKIFSNIITVEFPFGKNYYQIDMMIAENLNEFNYLYNIRYFNDEKNNLFKSKIKGLHKTELLRSFLKLNGYSLGLKSINKFIWNNKFVDKETLQEFIKQKIKKTINISSYYDWDLFLHWINLFTDINCIKFELCNNTSDLKNRLYINENINVINNKYCLEKIIKTLFNQTPIINYNEFFESFFDENYNLSTYESVLKTINDNYFVRNKFFEYLKYDYFNELKRKKPNQLNKRVIKLFNKKIT